MVPGGKTTEQFKKEVAEKFPELEVLGEYKTYRVKMSFRCQTCGTIFEKQPRNLLDASYGCQVCSRKEKAIKIRARQSLSHKEFVKRVSEINPNFEVISRYQSQKLRLRTQS